MTPMMTGAAIYHYHHGQRTCLRELASLIGTVAPMTPIMTTHQMTEGRLLVIGDLPVEAAAEVSAEEEVEVAKIVVGVERWIGTETIHHAVIRILTDDAHRLHHCSCLQVSTVQTRVAGHISFE